jgi:2-polyprenyl-6-methoxyphenol hydroxylase-like FAD-dependent oxidoreductase
MGRIVMCGAGVCGLTTAMLLAKDGHQVTVLERDPAEAPDPSTAWDDWDRRGVNQFRLAHFLLPGFRAVVERELPEVIDVLMAAGAYRFNPLGVFAEAMDPEGRNDVVTARRPLVEAVVARVAATTPGVTIRRGVAVGGVVAEGDPGDLPRIVGVGTESGEEIRADLVVDAGGRRSPLTRWLLDLGTRKPIVEEEDSGFVYYGRHIRVADGTSLAPGIGYHGSVALLALPADDGTGGIGIIASSEDAALRKLRHEEPWQAAMRLIPGGAELLAAEPISPLVTMAGIEDRYRRFVVDGRPVATGVLSVADAWACTNPSLGRGISLGVRHAVMLRDAVRTTGLDDPEGLVLAFDEATERDLTPWYRSTVWHDRRRLADIDADVAGVVPERDRAWTDYLRYAAKAFDDPAVLLPEFLGTFRLERLPEDLVADPTVLARLDELGAVVGESAVRREDLLAAIG